MATLKNRKTKSGHCVIWKSHPRHERPSTYQITDSALALLGDLGVSAPRVGDEVEVDSQILRPLRILGDLHFISEQPGEVDLMENPVKSLNDISTSKLSKSASQKLRNYITHHPRYKAVKDELEGDLSTLPSVSNNEPSDDGNEDEDEYVLPFLIPETRDGERPSSTAILESIPFEKEIREQLREWRPRGYTSLEELSAEELENTKYGRTEGKGLAASFFANQNELKWFADLCTCGVDQVSNSVQRFVKIAEVYPITNLSASYSKDSLTYYLEEIQDVPFTWDLAVTDALDNDTNDYDFRLRFTAHVGSETELSHVVMLSDGYLNNWLDTLAYMDYPETELELSDLSPGGSHAMIYSRNSVLSHLEDFVAVVPDYKLEDYRTPNLEHDIEAIESWEADI